MNEITPEVPRSSTARRAALMVGLMVVFFALINAGARWYLQNHGTNLGYRIIHHQWQLLEDMDAPVDWLVFGDSSGTHGIVPEAMTEVLGGTAVNLSTLANCQLADDAWMLQRYIERFGPPKSVVLVHAHDVWHRGYRSALIGQIPRPWGFWKTTAPTIDLTAEQERRLLLSRYVPLYGERETLKSHLAHLGPPTEIPFEPSPSGFVPARPHDRAKFNRDVGRTRKFLAQRDRFTVSRINAAAFDVIGELADQHGFSVYVVNGPMAAVIARSPRWARYHRQRTARLARMARAFQNVHALPDQATYAPAQMEISVDHVIPEVAPVYTRAVAESIREARAAPPAASAPPPPPKPPAEPAWPPPISETLAPGAREITMVFGGDASLARGIARTIERDDGDPARTLSRMKPWMSAADLAFVNLKSVLSESDAEAADRRWLFRARPELASGLAAIGVDVVSVANGHTLDFGRQGYFRTLQTLDEAGLAVTGSTWGNDRPQPPTVLRVGQYTVGLLAYTDIGKFATTRPGRADWFWPKPARFDRAGIVRDIERARPLVDVLIVSAQWGQSYSMVETAAQRRHGRAFVDAGADLIIGHHPHVPQVVEPYRGGLIAYSLGDFVFDKATPFKRVRSGRRFLLRVSWGPEGRSGFELLPVNADERHRPYPDRALDTASWIHVDPKTPWAWSHSLADSTVERVDGGAVTRCDRRMKRGPDRAGRNGYLRWLSERWACPDDEQRPWLTVARTGERSGSVFRKGIWAHPTPGGRLRISATVTLGRALEGFAGVPDWPLTLAGADAPPVRVRVRIDGAEALDATVPVAPGWTPLRVDTADRAGQRARVVVEIEGGPAREFGFVFDFKVDPDPVSFN